ILALISPIQTDPGVNYHVDHVHPQAHFNDEALDKAGVPEGDRAWIMDRRDALPNLQLLPGSVNQSKLEMPYKDWLAEQHSPQLYREVGLTPPNLPLDFGSFRQFYEARRQLLIERLADALGVQM